MPLPPPVLNPPFNVTRISHVVLTARDLDASTRFYADVLGLVVSHRDDYGVHLRGLEEAAHHSLVLRRDQGPPKCQAIGFRVLTESDLDEAGRWCVDRNIQHSWDESRFQGRTLRLIDGAGSPIEFCVSMDSKPRLMQAFDQFHGGSPQRLDHVQVAASDIKSAFDFYASLGFRLTEFTARDNTDELWGVWLQRKGNPHDIVFSNGRGPRLHHFAYTVPEVRDLIHACDVAASKGYGPTMERGPGRHGIGNALFIYFRDPDGHRIELFNTHYQTIDPDEPPLRWDLSDTSRSQLWGLPATKKWFFEATDFSGVTPLEPKLKADPVTLEAFLAAQT